MTALAQAPLHVTYGANGLETLSYNNVTLENTNAIPADSFHIWHMKSTDLSGNVLTSGQYGWGENNNGRSWNSQTHTWSYQFSWGTISLQYVQEGNDLNMVVRTTNYSNSGIIFDGASITPLTLNFPQLPAGFGSNVNLQYSDNVSSPGVTVADYGSGEVVSVATSASAALFSGFQPSGNGNAYSALVSGTTPDGLPVFDAQRDRPVKPGQTDTYTVSLRFAPSGTSTATLAEDAYKSFASVYPPQLKWTDRRAIGTVYLASSDSSPNDTVSAGYPNNPRRYYNDSNPSDFNIYTAAGLELFQARILAQAASNVINMKLLNAQGAITWDIEGEEYPQNTSYVCSPDQISNAAPEMESIVTVPGSPYKGWKLVDAYFRVMTSAGLRVGVCVRPQKFTFGPNNTASQVYLPTASVAQNLINKIEYAHHRWGATLFYIDSSVDVNGGTLDAAIFQQVAAAFPDSLLIPEETTPRAYAYTAPFGSFIYHGTIGTDPSVYNYYPQAFMANLINDVAAGTLAAAQSQLVTQVKHGDVLMAHADWWQPNNPTIVEIYQAAGPYSPSSTTTTTSAPAPTPAPTPTPTPLAPTPAPAPAPKPTPTPTPTPAPTPSPAATAASSASPTPGVAGVLSITSPTSGTVSGEITVGGQTTLTLDSAGTYLMVDGVEIGTNRVSGGPYLYPLNTSTLTNGVHNLQLWGHDIGNNAWISQPVTITVHN